MSATPSRTGPPSAAACSIGRPDVRPARDPGPGSAAPEGRPDPQRGGAQRDNSSGKGSQRVARRSAPNGSHTCMHSRICNQACSRIPRRRILEAIERRLAHRPTVPSRHRELLHGLVPPWTAEPPVWGLRIGEYRVFYGVAVGDPDRVRAGRAPEAARSDDGGDSVKADSVRDLQRRVRECVDDAQRERFVITRRGLPAAILVGVQGQDWEAVVWGTDPAFWRLIRPRRREATVSLGAMRRRVLPAREARTLRAALPAKPGARAVASADDSDHTWTQLRIATCLGALQGRDRRRRWLRRGSGRRRFLLRSATRPSLTSDDFRAGGGPGSLGVRGSIPLSSTIRIRGVRRRPGPADSLFRAGRPCGLAPS
jgi:hypothetical protein